MEKIVNLFIRLIPFKAKIKRFLTKHMQFKPYPVKIYDVIRKEHLGAWTIEFDSDNIIKKTEVLKKNLDEQSAVYIDLFLNRMKIFSKFKDFADKIYLYPQEIFSIEKLESQHKMDETTYLKKYENKFPINVFEPSVIFFDCGLKLLNKKTLDYIKGKDFIDGGAFIGDSALMFQDYGPNKVYAFEPVAETLILMNKTIEINKLSNVIPVSSGLAGKEGQAQINRNPSSPGCSSASVNVEGESRIMETTTIDKYVEKNHLNPGLIKLDVEGLESDIISQSINTIRNFRPILLISIYHNPRDFFEIKPFLEKQNLKYKFKVRNLSNDCLYLETMLIGYPEELDD